MLEFEASMHLDLHHGALQFMQATSSPAGPDAWAASRTTVGDCGGIPVGFEELVHYVI